MKAFGLELRRLGSVQGLYHDVDRVLQESGITADRVGGVVQQNTVAHALQKMLRQDNHFSVCAVNECAKLCGIVIPRERALVYSACHCMNWADMTPEYRQQVCAMVLDDFRVVLTASPTDRSRP